MVVERAKKCLDFTATLYLLHLLFCCAFRGWPRSFEWWLLNFAGMVLMAVLGEWLCLRKEMRDIPLVRRVRACALRMQALGAEACFTPCAAAWADKQRGRHPRRGGVWLRCRPSQPAPRLA